MRRALVEAGYRSSGIAALMKTQSFDNFSADYYANPAEMKRVCDGLRRFAEGFSGDTYKNFLFMGGTGLGKTHLSTSVAAKVVERGFDVQYVSACSMISEFEAKRFGYRETKDSANVERYYSSDLLIIDDFGTEISNQFTISCLYDVINTRMISGKSTVINTNLGKNEIKERYGDRITSRLFGEYLPIIFSGTDIREQKLRR
jgi:DNA replication protein DnaC